MGIGYDYSDHVAVITLQNARRANSIDKSMAIELAEAWRAAWEDREVRAVILTGEGERHFCSGHDLSVRDDVNDAELEFLALERIFRPLAGYANGFPIGVDPEMADHFPRLHKPVVAAVNGWTVGAGLYMLLASTDIRIAALSNAKFRFGLISRGWIGAGPAPTLLMKQIRHVDAMKMLLLDEEVDAEEAVRIGLVNEAVPPELLMERAFTIARRIAEMPPLAAQKIKEFATRFADLPVAQAWQVQSMMNSMLLHLTSDGIDGRQSFIERRQPEFTGDYRGMEGFLVGHV